MLTIQSNIGSFSVNKKEALDLELKINLTKYKITWNNVANLLYRYAINFRETDEIINVSDDTYRLLFSLKREMYRNVLNQNYTMYPEGF